MQQEGGALGITCRIGITLPLATAWCISMALLNGTLTSSAPDICLSSSAARWVALPVPIEPTETLPGFAFA